MKAPSNLSLTTDRYSFREAGRTIGVPPRQLSGWFRGYTRGKRTYAPVLDSYGDLYARTRDAISFLELIEARVVRACRDRGISNQRIRNARRFASDRLELQYPFATNEFLTDGAGLLYEFECSQHVPSGPMFIDVGEAAAQTTLPGFITDLQDLVEFAYDGESWPTSLYPLGPNVPIVVRPGLRGGRPALLRGGGISVSVLAERLSGDETAEFIARDYGIEMADIEVVKRFCEAA